MDGYAVEKRKIIKRWKLLAGNNKQTGKAKDAGNNSEWKNKEVDIF